MALPVARVEREAASEIPDAGEIVHLARSAIRSSLSAASASPRPRCALGNGITLPFPVVADLGPDSEPPAGIPIETDPRSPGRLVPILDRSGYS